MFKNRFLILRRIVQIAVLVLFWGANHLGWKILMGNLSTAHVFEKFYLADPYAAIQMLFAGMVISMDVIIGAVTVLLFYVVIGGRSFCSWVCPINIITDAASWVRRKFGFERSKAIKLPRSTRYWILALSLIMSVFLGVAAFEFVSPISMLHRGVVFGFGFGWMAVLMIFIFDLVILENGWCGHVCPLGGFYSLVTPKSLVRIYHDKDKCTKCMECKVVCPEVQVLDIIAKESGPISSGACTNCGRCIEVCEDDSLKFSVKKK